MKETKICKVCNVEKKLNNFAKNGNKTRSNCKTCECERAKLKYLFLSIEEKKQKIEQIKNYQKSEKGKISINKYLSSKKYQEARKRATKKIINTLPDCYIKTMLIRKGFDEFTINNNYDLIEVQRLIIKTKRLCKTLQS